MRTNIIKSTTNEGNTPCEIATSTMPAHLISPPARFQERGFSRKADCKDEEKTALLHRHQALLHKRDLLFHHQLVGG